MNIIVSNEQTDLPIDNNEVVKVVKAFMTLESIEADEVSIVFVDTPTICQLHDDYFSDPSATDCISFPLDSEGDPYRVLGEVYVCPQTAIDYCQTHGGSPYREVTLYIIHGLLHLIGLDDQNDEDRQEMRQRENTHLDNLERLNLQKK